MNYSRITNFLLFDAKLNLNHIFYFLHFDLFTIIIINNSINKMLREKMIEINVWFKKNSI